MKSRHFPSPEGTKANTAQSYFIQLQNRYAHLIYEITVTVRSWANWGTPTTQLTALKFIKGGMLESSPMTTKHPLIARAVSIFGVLLPIYRVLKS